MVLKVAGAIGILGLVLLAGCLSTTNESTKTTNGIATRSDDGTASPSTPLKTVKPVAVTDTLHLAVESSMRLSPPKAEQPNQTAFPAQLLVPAVTGVKNVVWQYVSRSMANISAFEARIWVRVIEPIASTPPGVLICSVWGFLLTVGASSGQSCSAGPSGPVVLPGDYELVFARKELSFALEPDGLIQISLDRIGYGPSMDGSVFVLTGAKDFDSRIILTGLREPVAKA